jgi:hypothetical protein
MKNSKVTVITDIILLSLSFVMVLCSFLSGKYSVNIKTLFNKTLENISTEPIEDIKTARWRCPEGYNPLVNYTYPGNTWGCNIVKSRTGTIETKCTGNNRAILGQHDFTDIDKVDLSVWYNTTLCIKRFNTTGIAKVVVPDDKNCPQNFTDCGRSSLFYDRQCYQSQYINQSEFTCPINYINIIDTINLDPTDKTKKHITFPNNKALIFSNNPNSNTTIPVDFQITENTPCIIPGRISNLTVQFPVKNKNETILHFYGCDPNNVTVINESYLDYRYIKLGEILAKDFYKANDLDQVNNLPDRVPPHWVKNSSLTFKLYYRGYLRMSAKCLTTEEFHKGRDLFNTARWSQFALSLCYVINLIFLFLFISLLGLMKIGSKIQNIIISLCKILFCLVFLVVNFYLSTECFNISEKIHTNLFAVSDHNCWDKITLSAFMDIYDIPYYQHEWYKYSSILFYLNFPYVVMVFIQAGKYIHKTYLRIRNRKRNREARNLLKKNTNSNLDPINPNTVKPKK